jgi:hypothetical protein
VIVEDNAWGTLDWLKRMEDESAASGCIGVEEALLPELDVSLLVDPLEAALNVPAPGSSVAGGRGASRARTVAGMLASPPPASAHLQKIIDRPSMPLPPSVIPATPSPAHFLLLLERLRAAVSSPSGTTAMASPDGRHAPTASSVDPPPNLWKPPAGRAEARRRMNPAPRGADFSQRGTSVPLLPGLLRVTTSVVNQKLIEEFSQSGGAGFQPAEPFSSGSGRTDGQLAARIGRPTEFSSCCEFLTQDTIDGLEPTCRSDGMTEAGAATGAATLSEIVETTTQFRHSAPSPAGGGPDLAVAIDRLVETLTAIDHRLVARPVTAPSAQPDLPPPPGEVRWLEDENLAARLRSILDRQARRRGINLS